MIRRSNVKNTFNNVNNITVYNVLCSCVILLYIIQTINWAELLARRVRPPFVPTVVSVTHLLHLMEFTVLLPVNGSI